MARTNAGGGPLANRPSRYALRQANRSWFEIPCRRAVAEANRGPEKTLLDNPQLLVLRPSPAPPRIDDREPRNLMIVSTDIHTDSHLRSGLSRKAALGGSLRSVTVLCTATAQATRSS